MTVRSVGGRDGLSRPCWIAESRPGVLPARLDVGVGVADQLAVDGVRELSFQAVQGFPVAFPRGAFALVAGAAWGVAADLRAMMCRQESS